MTQQHRRDFGVLLLIAGLTALGMTLWWQAPELPELSPHLWWPLLAAPSALTERFVVHIPFGRDNNGLSFIEVPLVLGLFFVSSDQLVASGIVGLTFTLVVLMQAQLIKTAFNLASWLVHRRWRSCCSSPCWTHSARPTIRCHPLGWLAAHITTELVHLSRASPCSR